MAIVYRWRRSIPGREQEAMQVMAENEAFIERMIAEGRAASKEYVNVWTEVWTNLVIVRGEPEGLMAMLAEPEHREIVAKAAYIAEDFRVDFAEVGETPGEVYGAWAAMLQAKATG
jgi:hypothetical protein